MTIGMYVDFGGVPILIADTMLTRDGLADDSEAPKAGFGEVVYRHLKNARATLAGYTRKLTDISPTLSYCWCGPLIAAQLFHRELIEFIAIYGEHAVPQFLHDYCRADVPDLDVIVLQYIHPEWKVNTLHSPMFEGPNGENVILMGSGVEDLYRLLTISADLAREFDDFTLVRTLAFLVHAQVPGFGPNLRWGGGLECRIGKNRNLYRLTNYFSTLYDLERFQDKPKILSQYVNMYSHDNLICFIGGEPIWAIPHYVQKGDSFQLPDGNMTFDPQMSVIGFLWNNRVDFIEGGTRGPPVFELEGRGNTIHFHPPREMLDMALAILQWRHHGEPGKLLGMDRSQRRRWIAEGRKWKGRKPK